LEYPAAVIFENFPAFEHGGHFQVNPVVQTNASLTPTLRPFVNLSPLAPPPASFPPFLKPAIIINRDQLVCIPVTATHQLPERRHQTLCLLPLRPWHRMPLQRPFYRQFRQLLP